MVDRMIMMSSIIKEIDVVKETNQLGENCMRTPIDGSIVSGGQKSRLIFFLFDYLIFDCCCVLVIQLMSLSLHRTVVLSDTSEQKIDHHFE